MRAARRRRRRQRRSLLPIECCSPRAAAALRTAMKSRAVTLRAEAAKLPQPHLVVIEAHPQAPRTYLSARAIAYSRQTGQTTRHAHNLGACVSCSQLQSVHFGDLTHERSESDARVRMSRVRMSRVRSYLWKSPALVRLQRLRDHWSIRNPQRDSPNPNLPCPTQSEPVHPRAKAGNQAKLTRAARMHVAHSNCPLRPSSAQGKGARMWVRETV